MSNSVLAHSDASSAERCYGSCPTQPTILAFPHVQDTAAGTQCRDRSKSRPAVDIPVGQGVRTRMATETLSHCGDVLTLPEPVRLPDDGVFRVTPARSESARVLAREGVGGAVVMGGASGSRTPTSSIAISCVVSRLPECDAT
eukprot:m.1398923 g.1398923  ORF g.1398923 m.1398923 type:complete len:143 (+) comp24999_c0_seq46:4864-5292(+)